MPRGSNETHVVQLAGTLTLVFVSGSHGDHVKAALNFLLHHGTLTGSVLGWRGRRCWYVLRRICFGFLSLALSDFLSFLAFWRTTNFFDFIFPMHAKYSSPVYRDRTPWLV